MNAPNQENRVAGPRLVAIVGPFQSGKTSLLEGILARGGAVARQGSLREGTTVGDSSSEARSHAMSVEPNIASIDYLGDRLTFFDSPGSIEFIHDMRYALPVCDAAVVVCEADPRKVPALQVILRELEDLGLPRILFLNKIDQATGGHGVPRLLKALRHESPGVAHTRKRLGVDDKGPALAQVVRTIHTAHGGKLSLARVLRGAFAAGATVVTPRGGGGAVGGLGR